jgi:hypothetical protein
MIEELSGILIHTGGHTSEQDVKEGGHCV